ncbi:cardiolipin synthase [Microbacterium sp. C7(2022)]|uniref:cardiolipin synthase n=1 Tax=Microbacterium sp. C7(2022) TaxID=2992759 RepID=UPI00237A0B7D|nr:cardiolipin synthase [Microbacterium sp. C7(2022)]MDE0546478.1 cardiolipin synthase [Microbacterium sp. C7(2022)]
MDGVLGTNLTWIGALLVNLVVVIIALIVLPRRRKPTAAMAWLLAIFLFPFVGIVLYLLIGNIRLPKKRRLAQQKMDDIIRERATVGAAALAPEWPPHFRTIVEQNHTLTQLPAQPGNRAELFGDYEQSIIEMARAMDSAKRFIHVEFYIVSFDDTTAPFFAAMERAVARGVTVRLLADHVASRRVAKADETFAELDRIGVKWEWMLPVMPFKGKYQRPDLRNHRKLVVVDGTVAFVGSQNLIDRSYNSPKNISRGLKWQELVARFEGPVVASVDAVFLTDWMIETGELLEDEHVAASDVPAVDDAALVCQLVPSGPGYDTENNLRLFLSLIHSASEKVIITSPYFVPDEAMVYAITTACQRGLEVQLFVSEVGDQGLVYHAQRSYYETLLEAGVRIFLYPGPFILHSKHFSIDEDVAVIGSSNMDIRSFSLNMEISMMVRGESFVADMRAVEQGYRDISRELTLEQWRQEPAKSTFLDGVARLTSALN